MCIAKLTQTTSKLGKEALVNAAKTSMASKIIGKDNDLYAQMAVDAIESGKDVYVEKWGPYTGTSLPEMLGGDES